MLSYLLWHESRPLLRDLHLCCRYNLHRLLLKSLWASIPTMDNICNSARAAEDKQKIVSGPPLQVSLKSRSMRANNTRRNIKTWIQHPVRTKSNFGIMVPLTAIAILIKLRIRIRLLGAMTLPRFPSKSAPRRIALSEISLTFSGMLHKSYGFVSSFGIFKNSGITKVRKKQFIMSAQPLNTNVIINS